MRPAGPTVEFDMVMRDELIVSLLGLPGVLEAYAARRGSQERGDRLIASVWDTAASEREALGAVATIERFRPDLAEEAATRIESLPIELALHPEAADRPTILRLVRGELRDAAFETYLAEVRAGTNVDAAQGHGPTDLFLAREGPTGFLTMSLWTTWESIEASTGTSARQPAATRHPERLAKIEVTHYELLPGLPQATPAGRMSIRP